MMVFFTHPEEYEINSLIRAITIVRTQKPEAEIYLVSDRLYSWEFAIVAGVKVLTTHRACDLMNRRYEMRNKPTPDLHRD